MATFTSDTFTDTNGVELSAHAGGTGASWTRVFGSGTFVIDTNMVYGATPSWYRASGAPATPDYYVEAIMHTGTLASSTNGQVGISVRTVAGGACYAFYVRHPVDLVEIRRCDNATGGQTVLDTDPLVLTAATDYTLRLAVAGTTLTGSVNGTPVLSATDATLTAAGTIGVQTQSPNVAARDLLIASITGVDGTPAGATPAISAIAPDHGTSAGGTSVVITGTDLGAANAVGFGTAPADSFVINSATQITAVSPPGVQSTTVNVVVSNANGSSPNTAADDFDYDVLATDWTPANVRIKA